MTDLGALHTQDMHIEDKGTMSRVGWLLNTDLILSTGILVTPGDKSL